MRQLKLAEYPRAIAVVSHKIFELSKQIELQELQIDTAVAFDSTLKNDEQRKARRAELRLSNQPLLELKDKRSRLEIKLAFLKDSFSVERLETRQKISLTAAFSMLD